MIKTSRLYIVAGITSFIGLVDTIYLSWVKITQSQVYCGTSSECEIVNNSPYSEIGGFPIAYLGMGAFLLVLLLLIFERRGIFWRENSPLIVFGISLVGVIYSAYLTYIEFWILRAICPYCVVTALAMLVLFVVSALRLRQVSPGASTNNPRGG